MSIDLCACCGNYGLVQQHHYLKLQCEGGKNTPTIPLCKRCHISVHKADNHFVEFGRRGGRQTWDRHSQKMLRNLSKRWPSRSDRFAENEHSHN